jgi:hypothetical protein
VRTEEKYKDADWPLPDLVIAGQYGMIYQGIRRVRVSLGTPNPARENKREHETLKHQKLREFLLAGVGKILARLADTNRPVTDGHRLRLQHQLASR